MRAHAAACSTGRASRSRTVSSSSGTQPAGASGRCGTDDGGRFRFRITKPVGLPGEAPRLDVLVFARGLLRHQLTRIYFPDERNEDDPVLASLDSAVRETLVAQADGDGLRFDIRMQGERATVFFAQ